MDGWWALGILLGWKKEGHKENGKYRCHIEVQGRDKLPGLDWVSGINEGMGSLYEGQGGFPG